MGDRNDIIDLPRVLVGSRLLKVVAAAVFENSVSVTWCFFCLEKPRGRTGCRIYQPPAVLDTGLGTAGSIMPKYNTRALPGEDF